MPRSKRQTVRVDGKRVTIATAQNGEVTIKPALPLEHEIQAEQVKRLLGHPAYGTHFLFAGDMNAARRGPKERAIAKATGLAAGEPDLRLYFIGGKVVFVENKVGKALLTKSQKERHPLLEALGFDLRVVRAESPGEGAQQVTTIVNEVLGCG